MRARPAVTVVLGTVLTLLVAVLVAVAAPPAPAGDGDVPAGRLVSEVAAPGTPQVLDGRVYSVVQVGRTVVLGGTFTRVREAGRARTFLRRGLVAFDAVTGRVARRFAPDPRGGVRVVLPAADGRTVFVGGEFTSIAGTRRARLAKVRVADGSVVPSFAPGRVTGAVKDLALSRGRLWVAGAFTHLGGHAQLALATVSPATGRATRFMSLPVRGHHVRGVTQVLKIAASPDGSRLVAIGTFTTVGGRRDRQLAVLDTDGRRAVPGRLHTRFYETRCAARFDTSMRDLDVSPDGSYVVVSTTGGYRGPTSSCDTVARFELDAVGRDVAPSWVDHTGGDTTYAVEATTSAVYVGGHQRWWNNPYGSGRPGPGAVARQGIAALDPLNGLPLSWDPGRDRGVGVFDFLSTRAGLWVASDTTRVGGEVRSRIARFDAGGAHLPAAPAARMPATVYLAGPSSGGTGSGGGGGGLLLRTFSGRDAGPRTPAPDGDLHWSGVRGAFAVAGRLHLAHADGRLTVRDFDGTTYGAGAGVTTSDALVPLEEWADDARAATGMFFDQGRIYFTLDGSPRLHYRYFSPESGVVGARRRTVAGSPAFDPRAVRGMFLASGTLYWATTDGVLHSVRWQRGGGSGRPAGRPGATWSTPGRPEEGWAARALFVAPA